MFNCFTKRVSQAMRRAQTRSQSTRSHSVACVWLKHPSNYLPYGCRQGRLSGSQTLAFGCAFASNAQLSQDGSWFRIQSGWRSAIASRSALMRSPGLAIVEPVLAEVPAAPGSELATLAIGKLGQCSERAAEASTGSWERSEFGRTC